MRRRFEWKRDQDLSDIHQRIEQVSVERAYRIVASLEKRANEIEEHYVPEIQGLIASWRRKVLAWDLGYLLLAALAAGGGAMLLSPAMVDKVKTGFQQMLDNPLFSLAAAVIVAALAFYLHFTARGWAARKVLQEIPDRHSEEESERLTRAFKRNTRLWRSIFDPDPAGWSGRNRRALKRIVANANQLVQTLNDRFTDPSGKRAVEEEAEAVEEDEPRVVSGEVIPREETV